MTDSTHRPSGRRSILPAMVLLAGILLIPAGYFGLQYLHLWRTAAADAEFAARLLTKFVEKDPRHWETRQDEWARLLMEEREYGAEAIRILEGSGAVVAARGNASPPFITVSRTFPAGAAAAGTVEATVSIRPVIATTGLLACIAVVAAALALFFFRRIGAERVRDAEQARFDSETGYLDIFENANDAIFVVDADLRYIDANRKATEIFGFSRSEFLAMKITDLIPPEQRDRSEREFRRLRDEGAYGYFIGRMKTKDGRWLDIEVSSSAIRKDGQVVGSRDIVRDITERERSREAIRAAEERYRYLFDHSPDGILIMDSEGTIFDFNETAHRELGYSRKEFAELNLSDIGSAENRRAWKETLRRADGTGKADCTVTFETPDGDLRDIQFIARKIILGGGQVFLAIWRDITERKLAEEEAIRTQRLESLGILAGGIAHDFNNLLTGVLGTLSVARKQHAGDVRLQKELADIGRAAERAQDLARQLLTFSKGGEPITGPVDFGRLVKNAATFATRGSKTRCSFSFPDDLMPVEADESQMTQVVHHLVLNACQAMPDGGTVDISCGTSPFDDGSRAVRLSVSDHGSGISAEHLPKIFDPFYSTSPVGRGLGLSIVHSIVTKHHGHITVVSKVGQGTTFHLYLPASASPLPPAESAAAEPISGSGRILVMDDEDIVRDAAVCMLDELGFTADCVENGAAAVARYREAMNTGRPYQAVILDLTVPGAMGGTETLRKLASLDPGVKAIVSSGYSDDPVMADHRKHGFAGILLKPYTLDTLGRTISNVL